MTEREIFEKVFSILDPAERTRALVEACQGDTELCARVDELIRLADMRTSGLLNPSWGHGSSHQSGTPDPLINQSIGGVKLVRVINEGGMGRVYEGVQENPRRTVAVKIVKPGIETHKVTRRFEFEAHVLAQLSHPGIGQIFAAGTHGDGPTAQPYFVMEYIAGAKSITKYAEDLKLSNQASLALFQKVCDAVAYGHQKGVIHRDLKPGNILVNAAGEPKVIDFGIAKTTDSDMALTSMQTDVGRLIGTYQYMSPEQFDADPLAIDVRSDVYALGVVLYELLTGQPPYKLEKRILPEIASIIRQQDPTPITTVNKTLRRDVGVIAGKCLEKDKNRRYSSASELAADVGRYLVGDPIAAVAPSLWDGVVRLARKHKTAAAAVAGIATSLVAAVIGISIFALRAERAREDADQARIGEAEQLAVATRERDAANDARAAEAEQRVAAEAAATEANRQLYVTNLLRLQDVLDRPQQRALAKELFRETWVAYVDGYGKAAREPTELRLLRPSLDQSHIVLTGHENAVRSVAFSPDGTRLATGSHDNTARLWDVTTGNELAVLKGHEREIESVAFSPDGTRLATGSHDNTARLWDVTTGNELAVLKGHWSFVVSVAFSPDGTRLATASWDNTARLWDVTTGNELAVLKGHVGFVVSVVFSPDGTRLATASWDNTPRLWHVTTGNELAVLKGHESEIVSVAFSPDGTRLATAAAEGVARLWDVTTGNELAVLKGHVGFVMSVAFSPDGTRLATGSNDNTARLWDVTTGNELAVLKGHVGVVRSVAFSPDGTRLATASYDNTARIWGLSNAEIYRNRLTSTERRTRLGSLIDDWFTGDLASVKAALAAASEKLSPTDWHEASNMVLERASKMLAAASSPSEADQSESVELIRLTDLALETCADLHTNTASLNFWGSPVTAAHVAAIPPLARLTFLNLGSTGLSATGLRDLDRFPRLQRLHLEFLDAEGDDLSMLGECPTLEFVSLWKSTVGDHGASTVLDLPRLTHLDLGSTRSGDDLFLNREPHDSLEKLLLDHTAVSDTCVASLSRWIGLKCLDLTGTAITPEGLAKLRKALPNCEIVTDSVR
jgi:WD40 repeat protein